MSAYQNTAQICHSRSSNSMLLLGLEERFETIILRIAAASTWSDSLEGIEPGTLGVLGHCAVHGVVGVPVAMTWLIWDDGISIPMAEARLARSGLNLRELPR